MTVFDQESIVLGGSGMLCHHSRGRVLCHAFQLRVLQQHSVRTLTSGLQ